MRRIPDVPRSTCSLLHTMPMQRRAPTAFKNCLLTVSCAPDPEGALRRASTREDRGDQGPPQVSICPSPSIYAPSYAHQRLTRAWYTGSMAPKSSTRSPLTRSTVVPVASSASSGRAPSSTLRRVSASVARPFLSARSFCPRPLAARSPCPKVSTNRIHMHLPRTKLMFRSLLASPDR